MAFWSKNSKDKNSAATTEPGHVVPPASQAVPPLPSAQLPTLAPTLAPTPAFTQVPKTQGPESQPAAPLDATSVKTVRSADSVTTRANEIKINDRLAMEFGKIAVVMMSSKRHRVLTLADLFQQVMPYVACNQYMVAGAKSENADSANPIAVVLWASVSDEIDQRLAADPSASIKLAAHQCRSGPNPWVIEALGPGQVVEAMLTQLVSGALKGRTIKLRRKNQAGQLSIETWPAPTTA